MTQEDIDRRLSKLVDMAAEVVEGASRYEQRSLKLIQNLNALREALVNQASTYERQTKAILSDAAGTMASNVADALLATFKEANQAAERARSAYERATRRLGWKLFAFAFLMQAILFSGGWLLIQHALPSFADVESRRQQLADLDTQVQTEQKTLAMLNRKGAKAQWTLCGRRPCVRVDPQSPYQDSHDPTILYYVPAGY